MNCETAQELLAGYVLEALEPDEHQSLAHHLKTCPHCAALVGALATSAHELPALLETLDARDVPASVLARLERRAPSQRRREHDRRRLAPRIRARLAAAALVAAAAIAVLAAVRSQQAAADAHQLRAQLATLIGKQNVVFDVVDSPHTTKLLLLPARPGSRAYGKIYTRTDSQEAVAFVNRLSPPPAEERYMLWIRSDHTTTLAGIFSLRSGFGYLIFTRTGQLRPTDAFVTLQNQTSKPAGPNVLRVALH